MVALVYAATIRYPNIDMSGQTGKRDEALQLLIRRRRGRRSTWTGKTCR